MSMFETAKRLAERLSKISDDLDIPESKYLEAKKRYEGVGKWLGQDGTPLSKFSPGIYPQGSFLLGTVVKPVSNKDEYDIDLVCYLENLKKENTSQSNVKKMVGDRLRENETYRRLLDEEGRRCWTLIYANEFHMDILPAIPDEELQAQGGIYLEAILLTDKKKIEKNDPEWPKSNPKGYAEWFRSREKEIFMSMKQRLAESLKASVDDVPDYKIKTPLQRAVQILKRHRDIYFLNRHNSDYRPISIIITTLAADLYGGQDNVYNAIHDILLSINENRLKKGNKFCISNQANPGENFADKWNEDPKLPVAFFEWISAAQKTFCTDLLRESQDMEVGKILEKSLGVATGKEPSEEMSNFIAPVYVNVKTIPKTRPWGGS